MSNKSLSAMSCDRFSRWFYEIFRFSINIHLTGFILLLFISNSGWIPITERERERESELGGTLELCMLHLINLHRFTLSPILKYAKLFPVADFFLRALFISLTDTNSPAQPSPGFHRFESCWGIFCVWLFNDFADFSSSQNLRSPEPVLMQSYRVNVLQDHK